MSAVSRKQFTPAKPTSLGPPSQTSPDLRPLDSRLPVHIPTLNQGEAESQNLVNSQLKTRKDLAERGEKNPLDRNQNNQIIGGTWERMVFREFSKLI